MTKAKESRKILLVDDETIVLDVTTRILESLGYEVTATSNSTNALNLFRADPSNFDLVITDLTMPYMTGDNLAKQIMEIRHGMPVIVYTGFSNAITEEDARDIGIREFLMKPFNREDLSRAIAKVFEREQ